MFLHSNIDPVFFEVSFITIRWYGVMYLLGLIATLVWCFKKGPKQNVPWDKEEVLDLLFYAVIGMILGGRIGYLLFYQPIELFKEPWNIVSIWLPGRSFHGGLVGVLLGILYFCKKFKKRTFLEITDFIAPIVPIGLGLGRLGNFINAELWGRATDLPWGVIFPNVDMQPRHPSQIYEFILEGILLFIILYSVSNTSKSHKRGFISGLFLIFYSSFRFMVEFVRQPDLDKGFIAFDWLTMGQLLSIPMLILGFYLILFSKKNEEQ